MNGPQGRWREPAPEEYSRVTSPERFLPLHQHALGLLARLEATYAVARSDAVDLLPGVMQPFEYPRPPVTLTPAAPDAAPVAVAFTSYPSLVVRYGRWHAMPLPSCGCDACREDAADQAERLDDVLGKVVAGRFAEELRIPLSGDARLHGRFGDGTLRAGLGEVGTTLPRALARRLVGSGPRRIRWKPWSRRQLQVRLPTPAV